MRVLVLGGAGNFGARIVRALKDDPCIELLSAGRQAHCVPGADSVPAVSLDMDAADFDQRLRALSPTVVVHTVGPFQAQDYRVARAALSCGAHYIDLADGRDFVCGFAPALNAGAQRAGVSLISGASTLPALSSAVVDALLHDGMTPEAIEIAIAPGQRAPRGKATLQAVFSYLGRPVRVLEEGQWRSRTGWMDLRRIPLTSGMRWGALCDVPDLELFPQRYRTVRTMRFHAALEVRAQHLVLWSLAALVRCGLPLRVADWGGALERLARVFDPLGGIHGAMRVSVLGTGSQGQRLRRTWLLTAPALHGPEIPCFAAILLVRRLANATPLAAGAMSAAGLLTLADFAPAFEHWNIRTEVRDEQP